MKYEELFLSPLGVAGEFKPTNSEVCISGMLDGRLNQFSQGCLMPFENESICCRNVFKGTFLDANNK